MEQPHIGKSESLLLVSTYTQSRVGSIGVSWTTLFNHGVGGCGGNPHKILSELLKGQRSQATLLANLVISTRGLVKTLAEASRVWDSRESLSTSLMLASSRVKTAAGCASWV